MERGTGNGRAQGQHVNHLATGAVLLGALLSAGCSDDGLKGELATKPAYADMSGMFYGDMCRPGGPETASGRTRALRIQTNTQACAVLYLDGVEKTGELMIYPWRKGVHPACDGLADRLRHHRAHRRVMEEVGRLCGTR